MGKKKSGNFNQLFSSENDGSGGGRDSTTSTDDSHDHGKNQAILKWIPREMKKQVEKIAKGHKNYELMLNVLFVYLLLLQKNVAWRTCMAGGS